MTSRRISGLYALTPQVEDKHRLLQMVDAALRGGATVVQYRNKRASASDKIEQCRALLPLIRSHGRALIVNDDPDLAAEVGADGVHIGRNDASIALARKRVGSRSLIGVSCYDDLELARQAVAAGADYVAFGSFFRSATKPDAVIAPLALLREAKAAVPVPVVAIGGIDGANAVSLIEAGADAVAILSALFGADDIEARARAVSALFAGRRQRAAV